MSDDPRAEIVKQALLELQARAEAAERERDACALRYEALDAQNAHVVEQRDKALADLAQYRGRCDALAGDAQRLMAALETERERCRIAYDYSVDSTEMAKYLRDVLGRVLVGIDAALKGGE